MPHPTSMKELAEAYKDIFHPCACGCGELIRKHTFVNGYVVSRIRTFQVGHHKRNGTGTKPAFGDDAPWQPWVMDYTQPTECGKCKAGLGNIMYEREIWEDLSCAHWRCMLCGWRKMIKRASDEQETTKTTAHETANTR